ncbi:RNA-binding protein [Candidatus Woesearchaeota archaeon]|nr:RNA-binding protein [Candidatus Woesearchaeota archaeon]
MTRTVCSSCSKEITNAQGSVRLQCPQCTKQEIVRCMHCREIVTKYTCSQCGFCGPN